MVDRPIKMAMNEPRTVHVAQSYGLEQRLRDAFEREWKAMGANQHIANAARIARIYGVSAIAMLVDNQSRMNRWTTARCTSTTSALTS
ncbi:DUF1073 domain-containing protein [Enterobacter roggenkampii]|uniref:DUF1073 domain-containing protein n=1 Tax=Enterobacter roggenkampii TaxID=1812935 RepID=UPI001FD779A1|nr:DUF1073 domain-containing protein [Enterobacter roggenkampii]